MARSMMETYHYAGICPSAKAGDLITGWFRPLWNENERDLVLAPGLDDLARFAQADEQVFVKAFITQPTVETLDESILARLAELGVVPGDPVGPPIAGPHHWSAACSCRAHNDRRRAAL